MKIELLTGAPQPPDHALIVCAGTVTCQTVADMGSGFLLFKEYFSENQHSDPTSSKKGKGWQEDLNQKLLGYQYTRPLPLYYRIAKQGTYLGGVATVACRQGTNHISPTHQKLRSSDLEEQYKAAVRLAIQDAIELDRPLYIQPLGIGVYGWDPALAATLFGEVLAEFKSKALNVYIPIYDQSEGSADRKFADKLQFEIKKGLQPNIRNKVKPQAPASSNQRNASATNSNHHRISFLLKNMALLLGVLSASFIFTAALAWLSILAFTPMTTMVIGATGIGLGAGSYVMFRAAKVASAFEDASSLSNRR